MAKFIIKGKDTVKVYYDVKEVFVCIARCVSMEELAKQQVEEYNSTRTFNLNNSCFLKDFHETVLDKLLCSVAGKEHIQQVKASITNNDYKGYTAIVLSYSIDNRKDPYYQFILTSEDNERQIVKEFLEDVAYNRDIEITRNQVEIIL